MPGHVVGYRFGPVQREASVPLGDRVFVIGASGITASKAGEHRERYNQAVESLQALLGLWRTRTGEMPVTLGALLDEGPETAQRLRTFIDEAPAGPVSAGVLRNRLDHFIAEAQRLVPGATRALAAGDFATFGTLVDESQQLAERWLGNQIAETSALARLARRLGAEGASAFGAGFGGSVWALVPDATPSASSMTWRAAYEAEFPMLASRAAFFRSHAGPAVLRLYPPARGARGAPSAANSIRYAHGAARGRARKAGRQQTLALLQPGRFVHNGPGGPGQLSMALKTIDVTRTTTPRPARRRPWGSASTSPTTCWWSITRRARAGTTRASCRTARSRSTRPRRSCTTGRRCSRA